ncbi:MAG: DNA ligase [Steroidobacteraceae bacterium]|jgi:bifunctional non-homologous end joining protein LigD
MSESRHSEIRLSLTEGTADKEYQAWLEQVDGHFHVDFAYGRRGSALKTGRKTASPLPLEEAAAALARLVRSKEAKGYTRDASGAAYKATDLAGRVSGHAVQLLNPIEEADLEALLVSTQHVTQEKFDGCRLLVEKGPEGVRGVNKLGLYVGCAVAVAEAVAALPVRSCVLDGEAVGATLHVFDLLEVDGEDVRGLPYRERLARLSALLRAEADPAVAVVMTAYCAATKRALLEEVRGRGGEGIVIKDWSAAHSAGRPNSGGPALKFKLYATATALVTGHNGTKRSVSLGLLNASGSMVAVGNVTVPPNQEIPAEGSCVEVRYLYATTASVLFQPVLLTVRTDILRHECTMDQLKCRGQAAAA